MINNWQELNAYLFLCYLCHLSFLLSHYSILIEHKNYPLTHLLVWLWYSFNDIISHLSLFTQCDITMMVFSFTLLLFGRRDILYLIYNVLFACFFTNISSPFNIFFAFGNITKVNFLPIPPRKVSNVPKLFGCYIDATIW